MTAPEDQERTDDAMYRGGVRILQHRRGYRFSFDAVLLAHEVARLRPRRGAEFGAGSGVVSLCLATMLPEYRGKAFEIQPSLAQLARENAVRNGMSERIEVVEGDVRRLPQEVDAPEVVFMNPPYFGAREGTPSPNMERALARHQANGSLVELLQAAKHLVAGGAVVFVYPGAREEMAVAAIAAAGLGSASVRRVVASEGAAPAFVVLTAREHGAAGLRLLEPVVLHDASGSVTAAHLAIVDGLLPPAEVG
ncbi:MAG: methyltransferase [Deltaproteobacteria bacterium]|nr:methyltransferase [Deltaproteobacteria bacterium]